MAVHLVQEPGAAGLAGAGVAGGPVEKGLQLVLGARVHGRLRVDEALLERQAGRAGVELAGQIEHLLQLGDGKVGVVELELFDEHAQHHAQRAQVQARGDGLHMPVVRRHRGLEVARRARGLGQQIGQQLQGAGLGLAQHADEAFFVDAEAAGAAGDLVHLALAKRPVVDAVVLGHGAEQNAADRQVQAHADGVGGHQDVRGAFSEALGFPAPHLGRQRTVDHAHRVAGGGDLVAQHQHVAAAEGHHGIAELQRGHRHRARQQLHMLLAFELAHGAALAAQAEQVLDGGHCIGRADDDHLVGRHGHDGLSPGPAARVVEDHLCFVDHGHVDGGVGAHHLDRAADYARAHGGHVLFAGEQRAGHTARHQAVAAFQGQ